MCDERSGHIDHYVETAVLQEIASDFSAIARVNTVICDTSGRVVVSASPNIEFFRLILPGPEAAAACPQDFGELAETLTKGAESARRQCLGGMGQVAVPIRGERGMVGFIVATEHPAAPVGEGDIRELSQGLGIEAGPLARAAQALPMWSAYERSSVLTLLRLIADMLGQLCRQESRLRDRIDDLTAVYSVADLVSSTADLGHILDSAAEQVRRVMKLKATSVRLMNPETGELVIRAVSNLTEKYLAKGPVKLERSPIDQAALRGEMVYIEDTATDPRTLYPAEARREGIVSSLVAGMVFRGQPVGVIRVYSDRKHTFSAFDESLLRALASQVATAICNAKYHAEAIEAER
ncbi:MAG: GAF domain-containing protein, partial [Phycisphaerales bacterium]